MKKLFPYLIILFFSLFLYIACDDTINADDIDNLIIPSTNVSYGEHIHRLFQSKCAMSGCHDDRTQAAGLILISYGYAISNYSMISAGHPETSKVVWAIENNGAQLMPPRGVVRPLTANQIAGIKTWIREGAKNN